MKRGPLVIKGDLYLLQRGTEETPTNYLGGERVARLSELLTYQLGTEVDVRSKGDSSPSVSRITGDWIEIDATFEDFNENFMELITNGRAEDDGSFIPGNKGVKTGHLLREDDYHCLIIRDSEKPMEYPALYIPYAVCLRGGVLSARVTGHTELAEVMITSIDPADEAPFKYGDIQTWIDAETEEEEDEEPPPED